MQDHFFHSPVLNSITSHSSYFTPQFFPFSFFEGEEHFNVLGLSAGNKNTKRVVFYDFPYDFTSGIQHRNLKRLLVTIKSKFRECVYIEIRNLGNLKTYDQNILHSEYLWFDWYNIFVDTTSIENSWINLSPSKRQQINKSLANQATVHIASEISEIQEFYVLLKNTYKNRVKKPLPDWKFFKAFFEKTKDHNYGVCIIVKHEGRVIAGKLCPISPFREMYSWYATGLDQEYKGTGIYPSVLVTWGALKYACEHNIPRFNFMGAGQPGKPYGVRDFKMQFGGELVNAGRYVKINKPFLYKIGKLYFRLREII